MNNPLSSSLSGLLESKREHLILLSPIAVILLGQLAARILGPALGVWSWVPLNIGYWILILSLAAWGAGREAIARWLQPPRRSRAWPLLLVIMAVVPPLPMLFPDAWRYLLRPEVLLSTVFFILINPFAEETYWRGLLLNNTAIKSRWLAVIYSSTLFTLNHMWMSVMVIAARNPMGMIFQFVFGVLLSVVYIRTRSLRWPIAAHFLTNLLTPTVAIFLNLYIPPGP